MTTPNKNTCNCFHPDVALRGLLAVSNVAYSRDFNLCLNPHFTKDPLLYADIELMNMAAERAGHESSEQVLVNNK